MTMPHERMRSLRWGWELLDEMTGDPQLTEHWQHARDIRERYPSPRQLLEAISHPDATTTRWPAAWLTAMRDAGDLFLAVRYSGLGEPQTRKSVEYTLRHFPERRDFEGMLEVPRPLLVPDRPGGPWLAPEEGTLVPKEELKEELVGRSRTIQEVFGGSEWLTAEQLNELQPAPPADKTLPAREWKRAGRVFSVDRVGVDYFPRYQFDAQYQPLPVIKDILAAFGDVADSWTLAAWFHFPSPWLVKRDENGATNVAPRNCLDRGDDVVRAAAMRLRSYVA